MAIITVSRGSFSGGTSLAKCVADKLGYRLLARVELAEAAARYGVPEDKLSNAIYEKPGIWERFHSERTRYLAYVRAALINAVKDDNVVYHGLAGHFLLEGVPHVLKVRVIANMEYRINAAIERSNMTRDDAIQTIKTLDDRRARWTKFLYHVDWSDPASYDMVINLDRITLDGACDIVCIKAGKPELQATPESKKAMDDLALSAEVRAIIAANAANKDIADDGVAIEAKSGVITIKGTVRSSDAEKIRAIIKAVPGVKDISNKIQPSR
jgi:cytidylate kinase